MPVIPKLDPNDLLVPQLLASFTVIAIPAALRHFYAETLGVEGSWAGLTAQQFATLKQRSPAWFVEVRICSPPCTAIDIHFKSSTADSHCPAEKRQKKGIESNSTMLVKKDSAVLNPSWDS